MIGNMNGFATGADANGPLKVNRGLLSFLAGSVNINCLWKKMTVSRINSFKLLGNPVPTVESKRKGFGVCWAEPMNLRERFSVIQTIDFRPGDVCTYSFGGKNKSLATVEIVKVLPNPRGVAEIRFLEVKIDDTGNGLFNYLLRTGKTMNASFQYLQKN